MRGDQLARQWRVIRAIEATPNGLTVAEIAQREETGIRTIYRELEALHSPGHAKAQRAPREIFRLLLSFLDIFLTPSHPFRKTIKGFSAKNPLRSFRLGERNMSRKAAKFGKKTVLHLPALNIYLVQFLGRVSQLGKRTFAFLA
jgi:hypothetical protein